MIDFNNAEAIIIVFKGKKRNLSTLLQLVTIIAILSSLSIVQSNKLVCILIRPKNKTDFQSCTVTCVA